jgi:hypothetical protein
MTLTPLSALNTWLTLIASRSEGADRVRIVRSEELKAVDWPRNCDAIGVHEEMS